MSLYALLPPHSSPFQHSHHPAIPILIHLSTPLSTEVGNKIPMILSPSPGRSLFGNRENIGFQYCHYSPCFRKQGEYWISVLSIFSLFPKTGRILTVLKSNILPVCEFPLLKCMHGFHIELCDCLINYTLKGVLKYIRMTFLHLIPWAPGSFSAPRALPGRPRASSYALRPLGGLEVPSGRKMAMIPRAEV